MVRVTSEIGRLRRVLVHEPGLEVDHMVPAAMDELLFDDLLHGDLAREEHGIFRRVLQLLGVEVLEARDLLAETLADREARAWFLGLYEDTHPGLESRLEAADAESLADMLSAGLRRDRPKGMLEVKDLFEIPPIPNWCFQRDPQVVMGDGVIFSSMATAARHREAILARILFRFHPDLRGVPVLHDPLERGPDHPLFMEKQRPLLEGGDLLVLSPDVVVAGASERTNRTAIDALARSLSRRRSGPRHLIVVTLPARRAFMHLDTVITAVDRNACLVYAPLVLGPGALTVETIDLSAEDPEPEPAGDLLGALREHGIDLAPIPCGGEDPLLQQREQWTDGANALAVSPGVVLLYARNTATADALARHGFRLVDAEDLLLGRDEVDPDDGERACILVPSHEISRARGGPHCLAHPLLRDDV
jgi:arginine deiminase